ncbi:MAG TPA: D-Ala-D-Ala carboxypeptidase family metallohydrolase [Reyranellaceae bacterium]|nr:D-Ala-D-Ala carboxypeptidase family metallohydrolase [Reyranellaceae bacterium]
MRWLGWAALAVVGVAVLLRVLAALLLPELAVSSWWRSPAKNAAVGGSAASQHLIGWALDLAPGGPAALARVRNALNWWPLLGAVDEGDHVHVQVIRPPRSIS